MKTNFGYIHDDVHWETIDDIEHDYPRELSKGWRPLLLHPLARLKEAEKRVLDRQNHE